MANKNKIPDVSYEQLQGWRRGQAQAFNPMISAWSSILANIPTAGKISAGYDAGYNKFLTNLYGTSFGAGGQGVSAGISGIGRALGLPSGAVGDIAAAGDTSTGGNVMQNALATGGYAATQAAKTQMLMDAAQRKDKALVGRAEVLAKKKAAAPNPLTTATSWLAWLTARDKYNRSGGGSFSGGGDVTPPAVDPTLGLDPAITSIYQDITGRSAVTDYGLGQGFASVVNPIWSSLFRRELPNGTTEPTTYIPGMSRKDSNAWKQYLTSYGAAPH